MVNIQDLSAVDLANAVISGEISAREVTEHTLSRINDDKLGAFVHVASDHALHQADAADRLRADLSAQDAPREQYPPLLGVPLPIKDLNGVAGVPMQAGSATMAGFVPDFNDGVATLFEKAGTIMVGKTSTPEIGLPPYTETLIGPPASTPWDPARSAGGSSGGAGAAVSARYVPLAHGTDGGGSIRIPAAACGIVGHKPSRGLVSNGPYGSDGPGYGTSGALSRTVLDAAVALTILSEPWPGDYSPQYGTNFAADLLTPLEPLRVGIVVEPFIAPDAEIHPEAIVAAHKAASLLESLGHVVSPAPVPFPAEQWQPFKKVWSVMAASVPMSDEAALMPLTRWMREVGREVSGLEYAAAVNNGHLIRRAADTAWENFDVIVSPTLAQPPALHGSIRNDADPAQDFEDQCAYTPWTSTWNIMGAPAISIPVHQSEGLPFGAMLGARIGQDHMLLRLAAQIEAAGGFGGLAPSFD